MAELNPYESPHDLPVAVLDENVTRWPAAELERALGFHWRSVCKGAQLCRQALINVLVTCLMTMFILGLSADMGAGDIIAQIVGLLAMTMLLIAWFFQLIGIAQLGKFAPAGKRSSTLRMALVCFCGFWVLVLAEFLLETARVGVINHVFERILIDPLTVEQIPAICCGVGLVGFDLLYNFTLFAGVRAIGRALSDQSIVSNAHRSLVAVLLSRITGGLLVIWSCFVPTSITYEWEFVPFIGWGFVLLVSAVGLMFYNASVYKIARFCQTDSSRVDERPSDDSRD